MGKMKSDDSPKHGSKLMLEVTNRTVLRVVLLVVVILLGLAAIRQASYALTLIGAAFFLALALNAPVRWIGHRLPGKKRDNRTLATTVSFLIVTLALVAFIASIVPPLVRETGNFIDRVPDLVEQVRDENSVTGRFISRYNLQDDIDKLASQASDQFGNISSTVFSGFTRAAGSVVAVLTVLVLTFMMLIEGPRWVRFFRDTVPSRHRARVDKLASDMYKVVKGYVNGQVVLAFLAATLLLPALLVLNIPYPAALVVIVFVCGLIPLVGHTIGAIIVSLVALFESPWAAAFILAYYILYQQVENYVVQPRVQANSTNMSPLLVFGSVIIGVSFGGLLAGLVAIPVAGCIRILLIDYMRSKGLIGARDINTGTVKPDTK
jgi:predicted PurR-regulated permease PerM